MNCRHCNSEHWESGKICADCGMPYSVILSSKLTALIVEAARAQAENKELRFLVQSIGTTGVERTDVIQRAEKFQNSWQKDAAKVLNRPAEHDAHSVCTAPAFDNPNPEPAYGEGVEAKP